MNQTTYSIYYNATFLLNYSNGLGQVCGVFRGVIITSKFSNATNPISGAIPQPGIGHTVQKQVNVRYIITCFILKHILGSYSPEPTKVAVCNLVCKTELVNLLSRAVPMCCLLTD